MAWHVHCCFCGVKQATARAGLQRGLLKRGLLVAVFSLASSACASDETVAAEHALATWRNKRPQQYTYVLQPNGLSNQGDTVRIKVEQEEPLEALEADGDEPDYRRVTMTDLLERALDLSRESSFAAAYDTELGYVKSFFYAPGPEAEPGAYGFDVLCLEKTLEEAACSDTFQMRLEQ